VDSTRRRVRHGGRRYDIVVLRDASEREAGETARREASALRAVTLLARGAAHEINNPLAVVVGTLDLLTRCLPEDTSERRLVERAMTASDRIRHIVRRMGQVTRVEAERGTGRVPAMLDFEKSSDVPGDPGIRR
jgi:nitrogen-specific signal transduction histidine kinase